MATVKINNKNYELPEINYATITALEEAGFPVVNPMQVSDMPLKSMNAFVMVTIGCDYNEAVEIVGQHILGGGDVLGLLMKFVNTLLESPFFRKMLLSIAKESQTAEQKKKRNVKAAPKETPKKEEQGEA